MGLRENGGIKNNMHLILAMDNSVRNLISYASSIGGNIHVLVFLVFVRSIIGEKAIKVKLTINTSEGSLDIA